MRAAALAAALVAALVSGCGGGEPGPPEILYGEDICDHCRMVISEERHAAAARLDGRESRFDDPGCLRAFLASARGETPPRAWLHDETGAWLTVEEAWIVVDPEGGTPMASGLLAFGSVEEASAAARRHGSEPERWGELGGEEE